MERMMKKWVCFVCAFCLCFALAVPTWADDGSPLASAASIGTSGTVKGTIAESNSANYYKYTVPSKTSVELKVTYTSHIGYSEFNIYDAAGNKVYNSSLVADDDTNQATEKHSFYLNPGVYYIGIGFADQGNYSFSYNTVELDNFDVAYDNTIASAHDLPLTTTVNGVISKVSDDEIDIYKLEVKDPGIVKYNLKFYMNTLKFELLDETGDKIESNFYIWNDNLKQGVESFEYALESGTYYVAVLSGGDDGKYSFKQAFTEIGSTEKEPNDTMEQAQQINLGDKVSGLIGVKGDTDFYKVTIPSKRNVTFSVNSKISSMYLYLYDENGEQIKRDFIWWNDNTKSATLKKIYKLSAGI